MINIFLMNSDYYYSEFNITNLIVDHIKIHMMLLP